jgi:hypothetical protein
MERKGAREGGKRAQLVAMLKRLSRRRREDGGLGPRLLGRRMGGERRRKGER